MNRSIAIVPAVIGAFFIVCAGLAAVVAFSAELHRSEALSPLVVNFCCFMCLASALIGAIAIGMALELREPRDSNGDEEDR
jgi:hypothetical protein